MSADEDVTEEIRKWVRAELDDLGVRAERIIERTGGRAGKPEVLAATIEALYSCIAYLEALDPNDPTARPQPDPNPPARITGGA